LTGAETERAGRNVVAGPDEWLASLFDDDQSGDPSAALAGANPIPSNEAG
jgi:hypothetical protein